jgi:hypothetical protein
MTGRLDQSFTVMPFGQKAKAFALYLRLVSIAEEDPGNNSFRPQPDARFCSAGVGRTKNLSVCGCLRPSAANPISSSVAVGG